MMTSTGHMMNIDDGRQPCLAGDAGQDQTSCASGSAQPRHCVPVVTVSVDRSITAEAGPPDNDDGGSAGQWPDDDKPRCERHGDRNAELYCHSCEMPICLVCANTRHLRTSGGGHRCWDIADAVDHCRSRLAEQCSELDERYTICLKRVEDENAMIESIRHETDQRETQIRRHFEEVRMRLEHDHNRLIQDLEMRRNYRIKELKRYVSELQATAIKLDGQRQQLEQTLASGSEVKVIGECAGYTSATRLDLLAIIEEPSEYTQPDFTKSDLLQQADNLVGQFTTDLGRATRTPTAADHHATERRAVEWSCERCTYINRDTDIECRMCAYAPWKQNLTGRPLPVSWNQAVGRVSDSQVSRPSTYDVRTVMSDSRSDQCNTREAPWIADRQRRSPNNSESDTAHRPRLFAESPPAYYARVPSAGKIIGTVNESTQTEDFDTANTAQKMFGHFGRFYQKVRSGIVKTPTSSQEDRPRTHIPEPNWSPLARWACSRCGFQNSMDKMDCEKCGFEEATPSVKFSSSTSDLPKFSFGDWPNAE